jgi:cytochrome P450
LARTAPLRPVVEQIADELLDSLEQRMHRGDTVDLHREFSTPLCSLAYMRLMGNPGG